MILRWIVLGGVARRGVVLRLVVPRGVDLRRGAVLRWAVEDSVVVVAPPDRAPVPESDRGALAEARRRAVASVLPSFEPRKLAAPDDEVARGVEVLAVVE